MPLRRGLVPLLVAVLSTALPQSASAEGAAAARAATPDAGREARVAHAVAATRGLGAPVALGAGKNQNAYVVPSPDGGKRVLKVFQFGSGARGDASSRADLARIAAATATKLRHDPTFRARFGPIVPDMTAVGEGATLQDWVGGAGVPLASLPVPARAFATSEAHAAIALAEQTLGGVPCSHNLENFLFEPKTGRIAAWFDHLSHADLGKHLESARREGFHLAAAGERPVQAPPPSLSRDFARRLRSAPLVAPAEANEAGKTSANQSRIVQLRTESGVVKALWKPRSGSTATLPNYPLHELDANEVRSAQLASALGIEDLVTQAVDRVIDGEPGALQPWHDGTLRADQAPPPGARFERAAAEKLRIFDFLVGNPDRQGRNMLVRKVGGAFVPLGIDYGLSFPVGDVSGAQSYPHAWVVGQEGPLTPEAKAFLAGLDPVTIGMRLREMKLPLRATVHALRRLEHMKRDPSFLEIQGADETAVVAMSKRTTARAMADKEGLSGADVEGINNLARRIYGELPAQWPDGSLLRDPTDGRVFLVRNGTRWHVPNPETFARMNLRAADVTNLHPRALAELPLLPALHAAPL